MRGFLRGAILAGLIAMAATPALAQVEESGSEEVIVTGLRKLNPDDEDEKKAEFLIKLRLTPGMSVKAASERIQAFTKSVARTGRTEIRWNGVLTLSVVNPDQYRGQIIELIAADAAMAAGKFGGESGIDVSGLDRPVEWARADETNVFLFLPASYVIRKR